MKICTRCRVSKPEDAFSRDRSNRDGRFAYCKACHSVTCRGTQLRKYGLTFDTFAELLASQNARCAICGSAEPGTQGWHVDHEHVEGWDKMPPEARRAHVRGILCHLCNVGLGSFRDSPGALDAAASYLRRRLEKLAA